MADIFTPEQKEALSTMGQGIADILQDRFYKQQFENFVQGEYAQYRQGLQQVSQNIMAADPDKDPDGLANAMNQYKELQNQMFMNASKYQDNPYISKLAQQHMEHDKNYLKENFEMEKMAAERAGRPEAQALERRETEAGIEATQAQAAQARAGAAKTEALTGPQVEETRARAGLLRAQAAKTAQEADITTPGKKVFISHEMAGQIQSPTDFLSFMRTAIKRTDKPYGETLENERTRIRTEMAKEYVRKNLRGQPRGDGFAWDPNNPDHVAEASTLIDQNEVEQNLLASKLLDEGHLHGFSPDQVVQAAPHIFEPLLQQEPEFKPLTGIVPNTQLLGSLGGQPSEVLAENLGLENLDNTNKVVNAISKARSVAQLGEPTSPLVAPIQIVDNAAGYIPGNPNAKFKTYGEMKQYMQQYAEQEIMMHIGGPNVPDNQLPKATQDARQRARKMVRAAIERFAPTIGRKHDLPGTPKTKWQEIAEESPLIGRTYRKLFGEKVTDVYE